MWWTRDTGKRKTTFLGILEVSFDLWQPLSKLKVVSHRTSKTEVYKSGVRLATDWTGRSRGGSRFQEGLTLLSLR